MSRTPYDQIKSVVGDRSTDREIILSHVNLTAEMSSDKDRWPNVFPLQPKQDRVASVAEDECPLACLASCRCCLDSNYQRDAPYRMTLDYTLRYPP